MESNAPSAIGIIMDGNRRWAKENGLSAVEGHKAGLEKVKEVAEWAKDAGVKELTLYAFSTENWKRSPQEVADLIDLMEYAFGKWSEEIIEKGARMRFIGERSRFPASLQQKMSDLEERTKDGREGTLVFALSYGGRAEILDAVNTLLAREEYEQVTEEELRGAMWSAGLSDPDLIIRTSGEQRLSNFLTWQSAYSELFFTKSYWPAFSKEEFDSILAEFSTRERRQGK